MKTRAKKFAPISEINVTPFVDVMLVLLIIFMVTAPMMQQGLEVDLPKAEGKGFSKEDRIILSITRGKTIYLGNKEKTSINELTSRLSGKRDSEVLIKADANVPYGFVMQVMSKVKKAGIEKVGMVTAPEK